MQVTNKPDSEQFPVLLHNIEEGLVKIPAFQREFVWPLDKTLFLLDSIVRGYPIGTMLFWQTTEYLDSVRNIGGLPLKSPAQGFPVQYVLDGQQRLTSLYAAIRSAIINGTQYSICVDLDVGIDADEIFFSREPDQARFVLLSDILGDDFGALYSNLNKSRQRRFNAVRDTFRNYQFSITRVQGGNLDVVCDLFERVNNTGVQLSVFDLLVARTWSPPEDDGGFDLRQSFEELLEELGRVGFDGIPDPVIAQLSGAIIKHECTRKAILSIGRADMRSHWDEIADSLKLAVDFVRRRLRIQVSRLLPYPSLLVPIAYFLHRRRGHNPNGVQSDWLTRYFYLNGFAGRLSSGTQAKLTEDLDLLDQLAMGRKPAINIPVAVEATDIRDTHLRLSSAYCKSILCLLASERPLDLRDGSEVELENGALKQANSRQFHHLFPKAYLRGRSGDKEANSVANIAFVPADLNLKIGKHAPSRYLTRYMRKNSSWQRTLQSHGITKSNAQFLQSDDYPGFLTARSKWLARRAARLIGNR